MGDTKWTPEPTTRKCVTCGSLGFFTSPLGYSRCSYCDGSEGGHPPTIGDLADRIKELEAKLAKAVEALKRIKSGEFSGQMLMSMPPQDAAAYFARTTLAELKGNNDQ